MNERQQGEFLDLLYGAAVEPMLWVSVIERFADLIGGTSGWISRLDPVDGSGSGILARLDPSMQNLYLDHYATKNVFLKPRQNGQAFRGRVPQIHTDDHYIQKDDLLRTEYFNEFVAPQEIHSILMIELPIRGAELCTLNIHRSKAQEQFAGPELTFASRLQPHLSRAFSLGQMFADGQRLNEAAGDVFDRSPHGLFLVDKDGRVQRANRSGESMISAGGVLRTDRGRLSAATTQMTGRLAALIAAASLAPRTGGSMRLASPSSVAPLSVTVAPVRTASSTVFAGGPSVIVCVTDPAAETELSETLLRNLFALTPAEARVALMIFRGATQKQAAESLASSARTVGVHLGRVFEKTGTSRQSELVRLMMRLAGPSLP